MAVKNLLPLAGAVLLAVSVSACTSDLSSSNHNELITLVDQGTFSAGGSVIEAKETYDPYHPKPEGMTLHGDHASVFYQIPQNARTLPLVFLHGAGDDPVKGEEEEDGQQHQKDGGDDEIRSDPLLFSSHDGASLFCGAAVHDLELQRAEQGDDDGQDHAHGVGVAELLGGPECDLV